MVQQINKKYTLGLPLAYFDWKDWFYSIQYPMDSEVLEMVFRTSTIIERSFDSHCGMMFLLTMEPVPRYMGQGHVNMYFPPTLDGLSEYITEIYGKPPPEPTSKT